jgi:hypothetical protein
MGSFDAYQSKLDLSKSIQTRDGRTARIVCTDVKDSKFPILALVRHPDLPEREIVQTYSADGFFNEAKSLNPNDLVNVPESSELLHIYRLAGGVLCFTFQESYPRKHLLATIRLSRLIGTFEE